MFLLIFKTSASPPLKKILSFSRYRFLYLSDLGGDKKNKGNRVIFLRKKEMLGEHEGLFRIGYREAREARKKLACFPPPVFIPRRRAVAERMVAALISTNGTISIVIHRALDSISPILFFFLEPRYQIAVGRRRRRCSRRDSISRITNARDR